MDLWFVNNLQSQVYTHTKYHDMHKGIDWVAVYIVITCNLYSSKFITGSLSLK